MKKLSQTWRQKHRTNNMAIAEKNSSCTTDVDQEGTPRRSQRLAKSKTSEYHPRKNVLQDITRSQDKNAPGKSNTNNTPNSSGQCSLFSTSFGFEFDADALSAVDKMEKDHLHEKRKSPLIYEVSPIMPFCPEQSSSPAFPMHLNVKILRSTPKDKSVVEKEGHPRQFPVVRDEVHNTKICPIQKTPVLETKPGNLSGKVPDKFRQISNTTSSENISENLKFPEKNLQESVNAVHSSSSNPEKSDEILRKTKTSRSSSPRISPDRCMLSSWGLPESILQQYEKIGVNRMFEWQAECLCKGNVLNGGNLVYSAPTSAGKTLVAELLMLKRILDTKCKALFILPFVSVAREKMFYLQRMFQEAGIKVDGYMGSQAPTKGFASLDVAVCTIEKANGLVNRLMEEGQLHTVGSIIVDEIHLIGDPSRGYLLELLLTKVLYTGEASVNNEYSCKQNVQIIGMSATLPNVDVLAKWLRADLFFTDFRPVPLTETLKVGQVIYDKKGMKLRELSQLRMVSGDDDHVLLLCQETVEEGHAVLMFCPTKSWCEKLAESVARHFFKLGSTKLNGNREGDKGFVKASSLVMFDYEGLKDVFEQLKSCQVGLDSVLGRTLRYGVAYHHAGLTFDERDIIEGAFRQGIIKVLIATSTLSSGVNLPARRVIIRTPIFHGKLIDGLVYKQMSGRAGRKGVDSKGESILICKPAERQKASDLLQADLKPVESCLVVKRSDEDEGNGIKRALLEVIASGVATTPADVQRYASCTFYVSSSAEKDGASTQRIIESTVDYLARNEFITLRREEEGNAEGNSSPPERFVPTQLGQATLASALSPDEALVVFADLRKARKCFVLENELHIIYQVTPIYLQDQWPNLDWYQYLKIWEHLPSHMKRVAELVGIEERFLTRAIRGRVPMRTEANRRTVGVHKRFYVSLALQDLVHEVPLDVVARKFGASRGMLQSLQTSAATFSGMVTVFCHKLGWVNLEMLLSQFHSRLSFGVERELCDLVRISALNGFRARLLYNAGYHTVAAVASASPLEIEKHLRNATPFQSKKRSDWESEHDVQRRMRGKCVWVNGRRALTEAEAAQEIVGEARVILKQDALQLGMELRPETKKNFRNISKISRTSHDSRASKTASVVPRVASDGTGTSNEIYRTSSAVVRKNSKILSTASTEGSSNVPQTTHDLTSTTSDVLRTLSVLVQTVSVQSPVISTVTEIMPVPSRTTSEITRTTCEKGLLTTDAVQAKSEKTGLAYHTSKSTIHDSKGICNAGTITKSSRINSPQSEKSRPSASTPRVRMGECSRPTPARNAVCSNIPGSTTRGIRDSRTILSSKKEDATCIGWSAHSIEKLLPSHAGHSSNEPLRDKNVNARKTTGNQGDDQRPLKRRNSDNNNNIAVGCSSPKRNIGDPRETKGSTKGQGLPFSSGSLPIEVNNRRDTLNNKSSNNSIHKNSPSKNISTTEAIPHTTHCPGSQTNAAKNTPHPESKENIASCKQICRATDESTRKEMAPNTTSSSTRTPICEKSSPIIRGESPELIVMNESPMSHGDEDKAISRTPFRDIETTKTDLRSSSLSPELYSEALFPDHESPQSLNQSPEFQGIITKMSESCGFETSDTSLELCSQGTNIKNARPVLQKKQTSENEGSVTRMVQPDIKTPGVINSGRNEAQERGKKDLDPVHSTAIITPGMFDSEVCNSQSILRGFDSEMSPDNAAVTNRSPSELSHRSSSSSFCLKLSQSFGDASDSDLSTRTLAMVAAIEEKEVEEVTNEEGSHGTEGFQVDSDISNETVAAIEAMEIAMDQRTDGESNFTAVKDRSFGFITKPTAELNSSAKPNNTLAAFTESRPQFPRIPNRAGAGDTDMKNSIVDDDDDSFTIIDVTMDRRLFRTFLEEWKTKSFSFSVALERLPNKTSTIGRNFNKEGMSSPKSKGVRLSIEDERVVVVGLAICWKDRDAYYVSLEDLDEGNQADSAQNADATPRVAAGLRLKERLDSLEILMGFEKKQQLKTAFGIKDHVKALSQACGLATKGELQDPKVAAWLLDPGAKERNFHQLVEHFLPHETSLLQGIGDSFGLGGLGLAVQSPVSARMRASVDAVLTMKLMEHFRPMIEAEGLLDAFTKIEMPVVSCLARMELNGLGFSNDECERIKHVLQAKLRSLEQKAYRLANHSFSLTSPEEVSRVLFLELKLPPGGKSDSSASPGKSPAVRPTRGGKGRKVKYFSTSKDVLEKLIPLHPLPNVILEWRRVNSALTKVVIPVQKEQAHCGSPLNMTRVYSVALTHTATGRVTFVEPNLQNVPKDFDINLPTVISDTPPVESIPPPVGRKGRKRRNVGVFVPGDNFQPLSPGPQFSVSMRSAFIPFSNGVFLAADYSQLELRLIAHLANDEKLLNLLNTGGDVFKMIGGEMFHLSQESISDEQRQRAKQVCYGIIYGIGAKALGQQLGVSEEEAVAFVDAFKSRFPGVRGYLKKTTDDCRKLGYVTTVCGRRRHLPNIRASNVAVKAHAERQAVNTTVQGSAADLVKLAMVNIDRRLGREFSSCWNTHRQRYDGALLPKSARTGKRSYRQRNLRGAYLVLQLHDELLFEVVEDDLEKVVSIVQEEMENAMRLSVKIPVKIKVGKSWGTLQPVDGLGQ